MPCMMAQSGFHRLWDCIFVPSKHPHLCLCDCLHLLVLYHATRGTYQIDWVSAFYGWCYFYDPGQNHPRPWAPHHHQLTLMNFSICSDWKPCIFGRKSYCFVRNLCCSERKLYCSEWKFYCYGLKPHCFEWKHCCSQWKCCCSEWKRCCSEWKLCCSE